MSDVSPARIGLLFDYIGDEGGYDENVIPSLQLVADDYLEQGVLERPVEFVVRLVQGLPNGSFRAVRDAFFELVEEDALVIFGPVGLRERRCARPVRRGARRGAVHHDGRDREHARRVGVRAPGRVAGGGADHHGDGGRASTAAAPSGIAYEDSLIGHEYLRTTRAACDDAGPARSPRRCRSRRSRPTSGQVMTTLAAEKPDAIVHVGFGLGLVGINDALEQIGWMPPRYTTTAFEFAATERRGGAGSSPGGSASTSTTSATTRRGSSSIGSKPATAVGPSTSSRPTATTSAAS